MEIFQPIATGAVSLFPLFGSIKKLRGFYIHHRSWSITFSTIFSLIIWYLIQFSFLGLEKFPFFLSWINTTIISLVSLCVYLYLLIAIKPTLNNYTKNKKAVIIIGSIFLFTILISSFTCTFNILVKKKDFQIVRGVVKKDSTQINEIVAISFQIDVVNKGVKSTVDPCLKFSTI